MENSIVFLAGLRPTANCVLPVVSVILISCQGVLVGLLFLKVVTKLNCSGRPWLKTRKVGITRLAVESIL